MYGLGLVHSLQGHFVSPKNDPQGLPGLPQDIPGPRSVSRRLPRCLEPLLGSKVVFRLDERPLWDTSADPGYPGYPVDMVPEPGLGPSLTTRAGGQDDGSLKQTPSNKF